MARWIDDDPKVICRCEQSLRDSLELVRSQVSKHQLFPEKKFYTSRNYHCILLTVLLWCSSGLSLAFGVQENRVEMIIYSIPGGLACHSTFLCHTVVSESCIAVRCRCTHACSADFGPAFLCTIDLALSAFILW